MGHQTRPTLKNNTTGHYSYHYSSDFAHNWIRRIGHRRSCPRKMLTFEFNLCIYTLKMEDLCDSKSIGFLNDLAHYCLNTT